MSASTGEKRGNLLIGFPRSGTTLLSRLIGGHPDISCPPETYLFTSAARFLNEQVMVEGPPIGVLSGLAFSGFSQEDVMGPLRRAVIGFHEKMAGERPVWVEKTAVDIFHLEALREFLDGHVKYIVLERNPLDVIVSNISLAEVMGAQLSELYEHTCGTNSPHIGIAKAWAERAAAVRRVTAGSPDDVCYVRYEDLTGNPQAELNRIFEFLDVSPTANAAIESAFSADPTVGLGDFNINTTRGIRPPKKNAWRGKIPPAALARVIPIIEEQMRAAGYDVPRVPSLNSREDAVRQLQMAAALKRDRSRQEGGN